MMLSATAYTRGCLIMANLFLQFDASKDVIDPPRLS